MRLVGGKSLERHKKAMGVKGRLRSSSERKKPNLTRISLPCEVIALLSLIAEVVTGAVPKTDG